MRRGLAAFGLLVSGPACGASLAEGSVCGNGFVESSEQCDDANNVPGDGCENSCVYTPGSAVWRLTHNGDSNGDDVASDIAVDTQGNLLVVGHEGSKEKDINIWVRKFDADGDGKWSRTQNGPATGPDWASAVVTTELDRVLVVGTVTVEEEEGVVLDKDLWIRNYDDDGDERWTFRLLGDADSEGRAVAIVPPTMPLLEPQDPALMLAAGIRDDQPWLGVISLLEFGVLRRSVSQEFFATLPDEDLLDLADGGPHAAEAVAVDPTTGCVYVAGSVTTASRGTDIWVSQLSPAGDDIGALLPSGHFSFDGTANGDDRAFSIAVGGDGDLWVAGEVTSLKTGRDAWLARLRPAFTCLDAGAVEGAFAEVVWASGFAGPGHDHYRSVHARGGDVFVAGGVGGGIGRTNALLARVRPNGATLWVRELEGPDRLDDAALAVTTDLEGIAIMAGFRTVVGQGHDAWLERVAP